MSPTDLKSVVNLMNVSVDWLTGRVEEAPTFFTASTLDGASLRNRMAWQKLKAHAGHGDEVWAFANPQSTWRKLGKRTGYAIVRGGTIIEAVSLPL
jgi:hypothetical protein